MFTDIQSLVDILGEDTAGQTVLRHVGSLHHALHITSIELAHHLVVKIEYSTFNISSYVRTIENEREFETRLVRMY